MDTSRLGSIEPFPDSLIQQLLEPAKLVCEAAQKAAAAAIANGDLAGHERILEAMRFLTDGHRQAFYGVTEVLREATQSMRQGARIGAANPAEMSDATPAAAQAAADEVGFEVSERVTVEPAENKFAFFVRSAQDDLSRIGFGQPIEPFNDRTREQAAMSIRLALVSLSNACEILQDLGADLNFAFDLADISPPRPIAATTLPKGGA